MRKYDYIVEPLLQWYDANKRVLPWREDTSAYRVWVSEIMLQQTRVEAVKPYFERFIRELPSIGELADAPEDRLLKLWEGLGYYNRVRNMQKAAVKVMEEFEGRMPEDYEYLLSLPGIGSYTAGAVASISFQKAVPAVDGNVLRIIARLTMDGEDVLSQKVKSRVEQEIKSIMPQARPGDFNQALMELGATVCIPNGEPHCTECPWESFCEARRCGCMMDFPVKSGKKARTIEKKTVLIIRDNEKTVIRKRPAKGLLAGMYEFPMLEGYVTEKEVLRYVAGLGYRPIQIQKLEDARHIFSHKEWHMQGFAIKVEEAAFSDVSDEIGTLEKGMLVTGPRETEEKYPIPTAFSAYTKYVDIRLGTESFLVDSELN